MTARATCRYNENGEPEVLRLGTEELPDPGPGELLVRTEAIGVTVPVVRKVCEGAVPLPASLGGEIADEVIAVGPGDVGGPGIPAFRPGDRVTGLCLGDAYVDAALLHTAMASRRWPLHELAKPAVDALV